MDARQIHKNFNFRAGKWLREVMGRCRRNNKKADWMSDEVWAGLQREWADEQFQAISQVNKTNRQTNTASASTIYRGGSASVSTHKRKLEESLGRPPSLIEQLERCWKTKEGNWAGPRAEAAVEKFQKLSEDRNMPSQGLLESSSSASVNDKELWLEAVGGAKKGRVWGIGSEARTSICSIKANTSTLSPVPENEGSNLTHTVKNLVLENQSMRQQLEQTNKQMQLIMSLMSSKFGSELQDMSAAKDSCNDDNPPSQSNQPPPSNDDVSPI